MKAYELAEKVGVAPTTISKIMNGSIRPKQETFAKICDQLCHTDAVKRALIGRYAGTEIPEESDNTGTPPNAQNYPPEKHLLNKAQSLAFKDLVANDLEQIPVDFKRDHRTETCCTDFLIKQDGELIALECHFHPMADLQAEADIALSIRKQLDCTSAFIVIPDSNGISSATMQNGIKIIALSQLTAYAMGMTE
jgi:transcriptional regulator with XRE-family HTH domain